MLKSKIDYCDALALAAQADGVVPFRRAIYSILETIEFGAVYFLAPVVAVRRVGRILWNVGFKRNCELVGTYGETLPELSQRELDVIRWIGEGKSNAVIAEILGISKNSVDSYVKRIFAKLGVSDRTTAAVRAVALGLISAGKHSKPTAHRPRWKT